MADIQRGLVQMLIDLDRRARPGRESRYRAIQKFVGLLDTVQVSSETVTTTVNTGAYQWTLQSYRAAVLADAPRTYLRLSEISPVATVNDQSTNATFNAPITTGVFLGYGGPGPSEPSHSALFPGTAGERVSGTTGAMISSGAYSVEFWANPNSPGAAVNRSPFQYADGVNGPYVYISTALMRWIVGREAAGVGIEVNASSGSFSTGVWQQVVYTYDNTTSATAMRIYINGALAGSGTSTGTVTATTRIVDIGGAAVLGSPYSGYLSEVAISTVALSSTRIKAHYDAMVNPSSSGLTNKWVWGESQYKGMRYRAEVRRDTPRAYWRLGEMYPAATANDESTNALYHAAQTTQASSRLPYFGMAGAIVADANRAVLCNGANLPNASFIAASSAFPIDGVAAFSLEFWFKQDVLGVFPPICGKDELIGGATGRSGVVVYPTTQGAVGFERWVNGVNDGGAASSSGAISTGSWSHVVATYDGTTGASGLRLFVNGSSAGADASTGSISAMSTNFGIGGVPRAGFTVYTGYIDEVATYDTALSSARVFEHYLAGTVSS